jgi:glucokinase
MAAPAAADRVVALDVGGTNIKGAVVDGEGRVGTVLRRPTRAAEGPQAALEAVLGLAAELACASPATVGVGLAVPGLVDERTGTVLQAVNLRWEQLAIGAAVRERLGVPVAVMHDVRAGALAEGLLGAARGVRDFLLLTLGTGVGAAIVIDGRPHTGVHGTGGELGHVAIDPRGPICGCGRAGCLEAFASAGHVARRYRDMAGDAAGECSAEDVARRATDGDALAAEVWRGALDALAVAIANYITLLDPELVVIGGGRAAAGEDLFGPLRRRLAAHVRFADAPPVVPAALGEEAGRWGAAIAAWQAAGVDAESLAGWAA